MHHDEQEAVIQEQLREKMITEEEAQKRRAQGRMHNKIEEEGSAFRLDESAAAGADYMTTQQIIEEVLDTEERAPCLRWIKQITGWSWVMKRAKLEREARAKPDYPHKFPGIEKLVHGKAMRVQPGMSKTPQEQGSTFELVLGGVLVVNGALIGIQASRDENDEEIPAFDILEHLFTAIFTIELILRLMSDGFLPWICQAMNFADFLLIVVTGIVPMWVMKPLGIESNIMRALQVLRVLRLIKLVRMVRTVPMFRIFWTLIRGILDNGRTLFWTYVMIFAVLYVFSIFGVYLIGKNEDYQKQTDDPDLWPFVQEHFGDVAKALLTLFQVMTLDSWTAIARPLMKYSDVVAPFFIGFILIAVLSLGNLVTAVIIKIAEEMAAQDEEMASREKREASMREIEDLKEIFLEIDMDKSGKLSKDEYEEALESNQRVQIKFDLLGIGVDEREEVFDLLDTGNGEITVEQFANGLRDMQGEAKAKDSFTICKKVSHINKNLGNLSVRLKRQQESADELRQEITEAHRQMGGMMIELREVMSFLTMCMPSDDCRRSKYEIEKLERVLTTRKRELSSLGLPEEVGAQPGGALRKSSQISNKPKPNRHVGFAE